MVNGMRNGTNGKCKKIYLIQMSSTKLLIIKITDTVKTQIKASN